MKHIKRTLLILVLSLSLSFPVFAQDATEVPKATDEAPVTEVAETPLAEPAEDITIDSSIIVLLSTAFSILAVTIISGVAVFQSGGTAKEALKTGTEKGVRTLIGNEGLTNTVENRLSAIPQTQRDWLIELVNLASPITDTSIISKDAAQWIKNVLDGNAETGAIPFTASSTSEGFMVRATTQTPNKADVPFIPRGG